MNFVRYKIEYFRTYPIFGGSLKVSRVTFRNCIEGEEIRKPAEMAGFFTQKNRAVTALIHTYNFQKFVHLYFPLFLFCVPLDGYIVHYKVSFVNI